MRIVAVGRRATPPTRPTASRPTSAHGDARYGTSRWRRVRLRVLQRDEYRCRIVEGCPTPATVADHVIPVHPGMSDELFFGHRNLRAGCRPHNLARGFTAAAGEIPLAAAVVSGDYT